MPSAAEDELGELFINCKGEITARQYLEEMGHIQPSKPTQTDNTTSHGLVTKNLASKRLKSMDTRIHWIQCRATQGKFRHYWISGDTKLGDYVTNNHGSIHYRNVCPTYLTIKIQL